MTSTTTPVVDPSSGGIPPRARQSMVTACGGRSGASGRSRPSARYAVTNASCIASSASALPASSTAVRCANGV